MNPNLYEPVDQRQQVAYSHNPEVLQDETPCFAQLARNEKSLSELESILSKLYDRLDRAMDAMEEQLPSNEKERPEPAALSANIPGQRSALVRRLISQQNRIDLLVSGLHSILDRLVV